MPQGPTAKKAAAAFDCFDKQKQGKLPADKFEDLQDELGEGFYGEEMEKQVALIDVTKSGMLQRSAFIDWYVNLVEAGDDGEGSDSDDTGTREEKEEERKKARDAFMPLATKEGGHDVVKMSDLEKLFTAMNTTYCAEDHGRKLKKLATDSGVLRFKDFEDWYINWMFGDDDSDYEEREEDQEEEEDSSKPKASATSWGDTFKIDENTWKCEMCMVRNDDGLTKCSSCETPRPGHEASQASSGKAADKTGSAIGSGGFVFGGAASTGADSKSSGFAFGGNFRSIINFDVRGMENEGRLVSARLEMHLVDRVGSPTLCSCKEPF